jgi:Uri superfamily endonuclease
VSQRRASCEAGSEKELALAKRTPADRSANGRSFRSYQIFFQLENETTIRVGALGRCRFPVGLYIYTGSARRYIEARIRRHLAPSRPNHWHIDYLLSHPRVRVVRTRKSSLEECLLNQNTKGEIIVPRLGASDCTRGCSSHLKFAGENRRRRATVQRPL